MTTSTAQPGFHEAEIRETLHSLVGILEDADFSKRAYAYTEDATFVMFGADPVHGREEMLRRLETGTVLSSIKITRTRSKATAVSPTSMATSLAWPAARIQAREYRLRFTF